MRDRITYELLDYLMRESTAFRDFNDDKALDNLMNKAVDDLKLVENFEKTQKQFKGSAKAARVLSSSFPLLVWSTPVERRMIALLPFYRILESQTDKPPTKLEKKELKRLRKEMEKKTKLDPLDMNAWALIASCHVFSAKSKDAFHQKDATKTLTEVLEFNPDFSLGWHMLCSLHVGRGEYRKARELQNNVDSTKVDNRILRSHTLLRW